MFAMSAPSINTLLAEFNALSAADRELAAEIINKAQAEQRRAEIHTASKRAVQNLKAGKVNRGSAKNLLDALDND